MTYADENLDVWLDDGTMVRSKDDLEEQVVGHRIVEVKQKESYNDSLVLVLDNGKRVKLVENGDCCAYTEVDEFLLNVDLVEHAITGVGTTNDYQTWHIFADYGDVLQLSVNWSAGNPFYYVYGFTIEVEDA